MLFFLDPNKKQLTWKQLIREERKKEIYRFIVKVVMWTQKQDGSLFNLCPKARSLIGKQSVKANQAKKGAGMEAYEHTHKIIWHRE